MKRIQLWTFLVSTEMDLALNSAAVQSLRPQLNGGLVVISQKSDFFKTVLNQWAHKKKSLIRLNVVRSDNEFFLSASIHLISDKLVEYGVIFREHHLTDEFVFSRDLLYVLNYEHFLLFSEARRGSKKTSAKKEIDDSTPCGTLDVRCQKMTPTFHAPQPKVLRGAITALLFF